MTPLDWTAVGAFDFAVSARTGIVYALVFTGQYRVLAVGREPTEGTATTFDNAKAWADAYDARQSAKDA